jgi:hypothetical protein
MSKSRETPPASGEVNNFDPTTGYGFSSVSALSDLAGLPMSLLISQPLHAVVDAQVELSLSTARFIKDFAIDPSTNSLRTVKISTESVEVLKDPKTGQARFDDSGNLMYAVESKVLNLPFITLLNVPSLQIKKFTIDLTIELLSVQDSSLSQTTTDVKSGFDSWNAAGGSAGSYTTIAKGSSSEISSSSSSQSIKYQLHLECATTTPPGVTLLLDFLSKNKQESTNQKEITADMVDPVTGILLPRRNNNTSFIDVPNPGDANLYTN